MKQRSLWIALVCIWLLAACVAQPMPAASPLPTATATPVPSETPTPSPSATPVPSATPSPALTSTPRPTLTLLPSETPNASSYSLDDFFGDAQPVPMSVPLGGFTFMAPSSFAAQVQDVQVNLYKAMSEDKVDLVLAGLDGVPSTTSASTVIKNALNNVFSGSDKSFATANPRPLTIAGATGLMVDLTGKSAGKPFSGVAFAVVSADGREIVGFGMASNDADGAIWTRTGKPALDAIVASLRFIPVGPGTCKISADKTYGYTAASPVQVGGGLGGGPQREKAFLGNLRGPKGEKVTYTRQGSVPGKGSVILDLYVVNYTGLAEPIKLYVDMYTYAMPFAPDGFTCAGAFTIAAP